MALTTVSPALLDTQAQYTGFKNRIINGDMRIDQRNNGASVTPTVNTYTLDRWQALNGGVASKFSVQRNAGAVTPPTGFINYLGATSLSAYTVGTTDRFAINQNIEGYNGADLGWGTASAATVTLSFWVRSSLTGTFGGAIQNYTATRSYPFTYSIGVANTWEQKTLTIVGDTTGTWSTDNSGFLQLLFSLGAGATFSGTAGAWAGADYRSATGAVSVVGTSGATFYITGVQLEKGTAATSFDVIDYCRQLMQCQRYLPAFNSTSSASTICPGYSNVTNSFIGVVQMPVNTRVPATGITVSSATHLTWSSTVGAAATTATFGGSSLSSAYFALGATGVTGGQGGFVYFNNPAGQLLFTGCEL